MGQGDVAQSEDVLDRGGDAGGQLGAAVFA